MAMHTKLKQPYLAKGADLLQTSDRKLRVTALSLVLSLSLGNAAAQEQKIAAPAPAQSASAVQALKVVNTIPLFLDFRAAADSRDESTQIQMFRWKVIQAGRGSCFVKGIPFSRALCPASKSRRRDPA